MTDRDGRTYPCPACGTTAELRQGCPGCGRPPDPDAAEVVRLDGVIAELTTREQQWRHAYAALMAEITETRSRREALAARVTARRAAPPAAGAPTAPPAGSSTAPAAGAPAAEPLPARGPDPAAGPAATGEVSTRTVQTLLFVLGGLLLGIGAIVFTAVAWTTFGVTGRAVILAVVTALVLAAPLVALRRRLRGTAETFAALGLLLVVLDGYAIWAVDLFGARQVAATIWSALVFAAAAVVAFGYARVTRLAGPGYAGLLLIQPVLPLLAGGYGADVTGWAYAWAALAGLNLALRWRLSAAALGLRTLAWVLTGVTTGVTAIVAAAALFAAGDPAAAALAGVPLLFTVLVLAAAARISRGDRWWTVTVAYKLPVVALVAGRVVVLAWPDGALVAVAAVVTAVCLVSVAAATRAPRWRPGVRVGGLVAAGVVGAFVAVAALAHAAAAVVAAWLRSTPDGLFDWQLPVALVLLTVAVAALVPAGWREVTAVGAALTVLSAPAAVGLAWWTPALLGPLLAAVLALAAVRVRRTAAAVVAAVVAAVLSGHALLVAAATNTSTAAVLGAIAVTGLATAVVAHLARGPGARVVIGRVALLVGLVAIPGTAAATVAAADAAPQWPPRAALAAIALLVVAVAVARRTTPEYLSTAAAAVHVATPVAIIGGLAEGAQAVAVYAGAALLALVATGWLRRPAHPAWWLLARAPAAAAVLLASATQIVVVLFGPYEWLFDIWAGTPDGSAVAVTTAWPAAGAPPVGLALLTVAAALAARALSGRWVSAIGAGLLVAPVALLTGLAQLDVPWPAVPATSLLLGLAVLLAVTLPAARAWTPWWVSGVGTAYGLLLAAAGLAGTLPTRWSTLVALSVALTVAVVIAAAGRQLTARIAGWPVAVALAVLLAVAAARAADLPLATAALVVLVAAAAALATSALRRPRRAESVALEAAAHAAALVALLLAVSDLGRAATVAALWGVALGLRALWPTESATGRLTRVGAALGVELLAWWLLLAWREVGTVEAYTVPAAVAAAAVGVLALRARPEVRSAVALGPALAAGFVPSLYASLADPQPWRRLLLGAAAVAVVMAGAWRRWRAPVLAGAVVATLVALRELMLVWQLLDAWIPLTVAGLVLVALAATYERRRRDFARLRESVGRMR